MTVLHEADDDRVRALEEVARAVRANESEALDDALEWLEVHGGVQALPDLVAPPLSRSRLARAGAALRVARECVSMRDPSVLARGCRLLVLEDVARAALWGDDEDLAEALSRLERHGGVTVRTVLVPVMVGGGEAA